MTSSRTRAGLVALVLASTVFSTPSAFAAQPAPPEKQLDANDRALIADAERVGKPVTILVAAEKGRVDAAADQLRSLGSTVESVAKDVDYLKVSLPAAAARKAIKLDTVRAIDVDGLVAMDNPSPTGVGTPAPQEAPGPNTPRTNPYMPIGDTQAAQFAQQNPAWDGKGVTIAIVDSGVDLDHPALAKTTSGERKVVEWYNANAPDSGDSTWVSMSQETHTGQFTADGKTWTAPAAGGPYSLGTFNESAGPSDLGSPGSELGGDVNRDGDRTDLFGVLQDVATKQVRVDLDQDGDFTDEQPMIDYRVKQDVGHFGTDNPATPIAERVPFVVQTDKSVYGTSETPLVNLGIAGSSHGSHVAGITAGNSLFGGQMTGAAPGAKLMSVKACLTQALCTNSGLIDGVLYAAQRGADVINVSITSAFALNDGNDAQSQLYNRIVAQYNVQMFVSSGNWGAGMNTVGIPSTASEAVSVGSYISSATWLSNYGSQTAAKDSLHTFSSRGPREDGGFKPDIVAPGAAVSSIPLWRPGSPIPGTFNLPPGYAMLNGTSMASPAATGAAALLVSAYKANHGGKRPSPAALRSAIYSSARYLDNIGAYEQGNGLFDVCAAYEQLASDPQPDTVTSSVAVNTVLAKTGVGINDREGVVQGRKYTRTYTLARTSGATGSALYRLKWVGNDGTFSSPALVDLPLNTSVKVDVQIDPRSAGVHSAVLQLDNPLTTSVDTRLMNTVVVPRELKHSTAISGKIARNQSTPIFVRVPEGTTALKVEMQGGGAEAGKGQVRFLRLDPRGVPVDTNASTQCYNPDAGAGCPGGTPLNRMATNPMPGVWEIDVEARRTSDAAEAPFTITATAIATKISPNPDVIDSVRAGEAVNRDYTVTNLAAGFTGKVVTGPLTSAVSTRPSIAAGGQQQTTINVPSGATSLRVAVKNPSDTLSDLDLFLYNCTSGSCVLAEQSADEDADESVNVTNPAAGKWIAMVVAYSVPSGNTQYDYLDAYSTPQLGKFVVTDQDSVRPTGTVWHVPGAITANAAPEAGRKLRAELTVQTTDGVPVGTGLVIINNVG